MGLKWHIQACTVFSSISAHGLTFTFQLQVNGAHIRRMVDSKTFQVREENIHSGSSYLANSNERRDFIIRMRCDERSDFVSPKKVRFEFGNFLNTFGDIFAHFVRLCTFVDIFVHICT